MRLSLRAIELCRMKYGKGAFCGFEWLDESILDNLSEEEIKLDFQELSQSEMIDFTGESTHISALGHHILHMMLQPEQYIMLDNNRNGVCIRIYIRNAYYLCVVEDKNEKTNNSYDRYMFKLLPQLDFIIGAFIYALDPKEAYSSDDRDHVQGKQDIRIFGKAWSRDRMNLSEITIFGRYYNGDIHYKMVEKANNIEKSPEELKSDLSELINKLTRWMFGNISAIYQSEDD